jgi:hypothetical protein
MKIEMKKYDMTRMAAPEDVARFEQAGWAVAEASKPQPKKIVEAGEVKAKAPVKSKSTEETTLDNPNNIQGE